MASAREGTARVDRGDAARRSGGGSRGLFLGAQRRRDGVLRRAAPVGTRWSSRPRGARGGPRGRGVGRSHVSGLFERHGLVLGLLAIAAVATLVLAWRTFGSWATVIGAYACAVPVLLAATRSLEGFVDSARAALVLPLLVVLWRLGPRYRPWAAFATAVTGLLLLSGTIQSFGRQSLYAFPIFWAIADGPRWLRYPPFAVLGFASNLGLVLLLTHFAP